MGEFMSIESKFSVKTVYDDDMYPSKGDFENEKLLNHLKDFYSRSCSEDSFYASGKVGEIYPLLKSKDKENLHKILIVWARFKDFGVPQYYFRSGAAELFGAIAPHLTYLEIQKIQKDIIPLKTDFSRVVCRKAEETEKAFKLRLEVLALNSREKYRSQL